ncbi:hypothetical protein RRG08_050146 [Elysia crispata]|uniref:Uncharacterized protein n=1 Tax=Elysia crispata TaxID=231223 RepID=A0AAE1DW69_9GAST|nr:hypothetical protein RRG08_050146 [Elysia crispata]
MVQRESPPVVHTVEKFTGVAPGAGQDQLCPLVLWSSRYVHLQPQELAGQSRDVQSQGVDTGHKVAEMEIVYKEAILSSKYRTCVTRQQISRVMHAPLSKELDTFESQSYLYFTAKVIRNHRIAASQA